MIVIVRLAFLCLLLCPVSALGQSKFNVCMVLTSWWDNNAALGTSNDLLGQVKSVPGREPLIKSVKDEDSGNSRRPVPTRAARQRDRLRVGVSRRAEARRTSAARVSA